MRFEFGGQSGADPDNSFANTARLLNCYRELTTDGELYIKSSPGVEPFADLDGVYSRAATVANGLIYSVHGGKLWRIQPDGAARGFGNIADSPITSISSNNGAVTVVADNKYYLFNGLSVSQPSTGAFANCCDVAFFGQLTVLLEANGRRVQWSDVADPATLDGLSFATTESRDDKNLRVLPQGSSLWIFKETCIERWQQNGADLQAIAGGTIDTGLKSRSLLTATPNGCFFIGNDGKVYLVRGGAMQPLANIAVETSISKQDPIGCVYYQDEGHEVCVITFSDRPAWCYDISMGEWHERPDFNVRTSVQAYGRSFVSTDAYGLFRMARNQQDFDKPLTSRMIGRTISNAGKFFTVSEFRTPCRVGQIAGDNVLITDAGLDADPGLLQTGPTDGLEVGIAPRHTAALMLRTSRDSGHIWGPYKPRSLGHIGEYNRQVVWRALGRFKQFTPELSWTENAEFAVAAKVDLELS